MTSLRDFVVEYAVKAKSNNRISIVSSMDVSDSQSLWYDSDSDE